MARVDAYTYMGIYRVSSVACSSLVWDVSKGEGWSAGSASYDEPAFGICGYCDVPGVPGKCLNCGATVHQITDTERDARAELSRRIWAKRIKAAEAPSLV
jgi:hypothetical protein